MRLYDLASLPRDLSRQLATFNVMDGDPPQDLALIRRMRRLGYPTSQYHAVFVADSGGLRSRVEALRLAFTSSRGRDMVTGVTAVMTHPEATGRGYAATALREVHRREALGGSQWSFLWTHRTWGAHRLYETLGYRDLFQPPSAARRIPAFVPRARRRSNRLKRARLNDSAALEHLVDDCTGGRWGFLPRYRGSFRLKFNLGWRSPSNHLLLLQDGHTIGYAHAVSNPQSLVANEVCVPTPKDANAVVDELERVAAGRWMVFEQTTFVSDHAPMLEARGYSVVRPAHLTLMGRPLGRVREPAVRAVQTVFRDPRFSCHRGDVF